MHILYPEGQCPPSMPIAVIVKFNVHTGPNFLDDYPQCVPILLATFVWESSGQCMLITTADTTTVTLCNNNPQEPGSDLSD